MCLPGRGTHITRHMCFPGRGTYITRGSCFPSGETHITRDMCFPDRGTHITRDMCFSGRGTHFTSDMFCPGWGTHITRDMCSQKRICVSQVVQTKLALLFAFQAKCLSFYANVHFRYKRSRNGRGRLLRHRELVYRRVR